MKILLVEDEAPLAMGIEYALNKEGFNIITAKNLEQARGCFNKDIELILLDVMLPDGNGYDFCKEIRMKSSTPVIFMTALDDEANIIFGLDIGGDDYITKPVRIGELVSRINALMRRQRKNRETAPNKSIVSGSVTVEPLKCKVYIREDEINLTAAEYKLLLLMIENKNQVLNRTAIIEKLWDIDGNFIDNNTLNVYMKRLREKLGDEAGKYITTIRGIGYMWKDDGRNL
ncbi:putative response regulator ArlR [Clostridiales bacterium oral taxon 876 str. F0540]|nr:putative response regulator ArlR [Clostridiales bacterium oral taxon 876 str. F0540]